MLSRFDFVKKCVRYNFILHIFFALYTHTVYQLSSYRAFVSNNDFLDHGFVEKMKSSIRMFYGRLHDVVDRYIFVTKDHGYVPFFVYTMPFYIPNCVIIELYVSSDLICMSSTTGAIQGAGIADLSGAPEFGLDLWWGLCRSTFVFTLTCFVNVSCLFVFLIFWISLMIFNCLLYIFSVSS